MITLLVSAAVSFADDLTKQPAAEVVACNRSAYEARKKTTPKKADGQIQLALWCEAHGL